MRMVLRIGPPSYTILARSCVSLCCCCTEPSETKAASRWLFTYTILQRAVPKLVPRRDNTVLKSAAAVAQWLLYRSV